MPYMQALNLVRCGEKKPHFASADARRPEGRGSTCRLREVERMRPERSPTDYSECKAAKKSVSRSSHHPNLLGFLLLAQKSVPLRRLPLLLALARSLGAGTLGVHLLLDLLLACLLGLGPVNLSQRQHLFVDVWLWRNLRAQQARACA